MMNSFSSSFMLMIKLGSLLYVYMEYELFLDKIGILQ